MRRTLFWSPLGLSLVLGMLMNSADGETRTQSQGILDFDGMDEEDSNDARPRMARRIHAGRGFCGT